MTPTVHDSPHRELRGERLRELARHAGGAARSEPLARALSSWASPDVVRRELGQAFGGRSVIVTGTIDERLLAVQQDGSRWWLATLGRRTLGELPLPRGIEPRDGLAHVSEALLPDPALLRLTRPLTRLIALYHPEQFPLPRFPLGISDLARALRAAYAGEVRLSDMQLGATLADILAEVSLEQPDIIGVSATFGQHDLLQELLTRLEPVRTARQLVVLGGSLSALNAEPLLERYPWLLVATASGEATILDVVAHWHGDIEIGQVRHLRHAQGEGLLRPRRARRSFNREQADFLPELDLLVPTLSRFGVMQLESSRGCTHACSFCPREHKGLWVGDAPEHLERVLPDIADVYARFPETARKIFLVDEEFIGMRGAEDTSERARHVCAVLAQHGFRWETSSRVDQVYRPDRDAAWNVARLELWQHFRANGLDRCLFGVESGVDSVLARFNKRTTAAQNATAVRLLSALGVPIRCTYITFDHLMSLEELRETYEFQGRRDLLLQPLPHLPLEELFERVHDPDFVREHGTGLPFYTHVSYMLVSMECLLGSPYLREVERLGLAGELRLSMGRRDASYRDARIGSMSDWSQRWVDRNFSLDYTLKSLEKLSEKADRAGIRRLRYALRSHAYDLLGAFIGSYPELSGSGGTALLEAACERQFSALVGSINALAAEARLPTERQQLLLTEVQRWQSRTSWELINGAN